MKIVEIMTTRVELIAPDATVQKAGEKMAEHDIGALLVGTAETLSGILTDRDILIRVVVEGLDPKTVRVQDVMSRQLFTCRSESRLEDAFAEMRERQVRRLPVVDESGVLVGIVTLSDLATKGDQSAAPERLRVIAEPHRVETVAEDDGPGGNPPPDALPPAGDPPAA